MIPWAGRLHALHGKWAKLAAMNQSQIDWPDEWDQAAELTQYAAEGRYPGVVEPVSEEEYHQVLMIAEKVLAWAVNSIESPSS